MKSTPLFLMIMLFAGAASLVAVGCRRTAAVPPPATKAAADPPAGLAVGTFNGIMLLNEAGEKVRYLTNAHDTDPVWSPDGQQLAFVRITDSQQFVYIADGDGSNPRRLTSATDRIELRPSWSPDGTEIALWIVLPSGNDEIRIVPARGGEERTVVGQADKPCFPEWSKDAHAGNPLLFCKRPSTDNELGANIWTMKGPSSESAITKGEATSTDPILSPDGKMIAFLRESAPSVMRTDGTQIKQLVPAGDFMDGMAWSPTGDRIAILRTPEAGEAGSAESALWTVAPDGSGLKCVRKFDSQLSGICWR